MNDTGRLDTQAPLYIPSGTEVELFTAAWSRQLPVLLKGPTGVGKTRLVEHMAQRLNRPLVTVACHEDLSAADLVGRYVLRGDDTVWIDGPLTQAVKQGAICYLDEVVEARADTVVVLHPLMDHRRELHIDRLGTMLKADPGFMLVMSYNPGYQTLAKDLKPSTRQRMVAIELSFPTPQVEAAVLTQLYGVDTAVAQKLAQFAQAARRSPHSGLDETISPRALISAALLMQAGISQREAMKAATAAALSDDPAVVAGLMELVDVYLA